MIRKAYEINLDGLVGPTHHYAGLSYGNLASEASRLTVSNPQEAALQGLNKMKLLSDLGVKQAVWPPQERPDIEGLRRMGFYGSEAQILREAHRQDPALLAACTSASSMWTANAATVSPSADTADGRVHFTPANLITHFHRSIEPPMTAILLKTIFPDESVFAHHPPLPANFHFCDEGAANHMRLCGAHPERGIEVFVYGAKAFDPADRRPVTYPARQTLEASRAIARLHQLNPDHVIFMKQSPDLIDAGIFHNDLVAVGNENVLLYHTLAFSDSPKVMDEIKRRFSTITQRDFILIEARPEEVPMEDAVQSYLFNSQLVTLPDETMCLIAPAECLENPRTQRFLEQVIAGENPIRAVRYVNLRQSMRNGGGPACLRLRMVLTETEMARAHQPIFLTDPLYRDLTGWIHRYYRDRLHLNDLSDPEMLSESRAALDALTQILKLGSIYRFQQAERS